MKHLASGNNDWSFVDIFGRKCICRQNKLEDFPRKMFSAGNMMDSLTIVHYSYIWERRGLRGETEPSLCNFIKTVHI